MNIHSQARTTAIIRQEIKDSALSERACAEKYNVTRDTVRKWKKRDKTVDLSHKPHVLHTTLTPLQELIVVHLRVSLLLPLDDLFVIVRDHVNADVSRSGLGRCLRRHKVSNLRDLIPDVEGEVVKKTFKDYEPGYIHIDIKYLPQMPDETSRRYLFVAIDRATRWVFLKIYDHQTAENSVNFLTLLKQKCPIRIKTILTDNGTQFTDRFTSKEKKVTGKHDFDMACTQEHIAHRLIKPRHPQTNGMVERFNGRISELIAQTKFISRKDLEDTILKYEILYNHHIPQRSINHLTPMKKMFEWYKSKPELFLTEVYDQTGLDT